MKWTVSRDLPVHIVRDGALNLASDSMVAILSDHFKAVPENGRSARECSVRLTDKYLSYQLVSTPSSGANENSAISNTNCYDDANLVALPVNDIVGCHVMRSQPPGNRIQESNANDVDKLQRTSYLVIHAYTARHRARLGLMRQVKRLRMTVVFALSKCDTWEENFAVAEKWRKTILWLLIDKSRVYQTSPSFTVNIPNESPRTRNLLILINPASGSGKALEIFEQRVAGVLAESGLKFEVITTKAAGNASKYIKTTEDLLIKYDGIVIVSGDGLLFEVFNGLMQRSDWQDTCKIPIGIIPGGSGNGLAHSINYAVGDRVVCNPILASTLNVACGKSAPLDLVKVSSEKETFYSFLSVGWGLLADIDIESERLRLVGGARFTIWAVVRTLSLRKYKGKLSYLPVKGYEKAHETPKKSGQRPDRNLLSSKSVDDSNGFASCGESSDEETLRASRSMSAPLGASGVDNAGAEKEMMGHSGEVEKDAAEVLVNRGKSRARNEVPVAVVPPPLSDAVPSDWVIIDDEFVCVYSAHQTHLSGDCLFAPQAKPDDGLIWLLFIRGNVSRGQILQFLTALDSGGHVNLPFVKLIPVHAFRLEPHNSEGRLTIDGELVECCPVQAEVMPSVARIMTR